MCDHNNTIRVPIGGGYVLVVCKNCKAETLESKSNDDS